MKNNLSILPSTGANNYLPAIEPTSLSPVITTKKLYGNETGMSPNLNILFKQVAARLSDIEMDIDCYDVSHLNFSAHVLKDLFLAMNMQAAYLYTAQMEEMVKEEKLQEVKDLLLEIKKIIAQAVQNNQQQID